MSYKIAIDGPASAGKSTIAKALAKELGYIYIDTGAMYRAIAYYVLDHGIDFHDEEKVVSVLDNIEVSLDYDKENTLHVYLNNKDISNKIRTQEIGEAASVTSQYKMLREKLVLLQRKLADEKSCVMDGRDIASNVLKDANLKIYLTASVDCRAKRRLLEEREKGIDTDFEKVKNELIERDHRDTTRAHNPLVKVTDAYEIDTTSKSIDEVIDFILKEFF